jgi:FkbM family methyltransferase
MDVGSNIGYFTVLANAYHPNIKTYSFEPARGAFHFLSKNILQNQCSNSTPIQTALSDMNGRIDFYELKNKKFPYLTHFLNGANTTVVKNYNVPTSKYSVDCCTLDDFVSKHTIQKLDLIKLDTEFTEHLILSAAENTLLQFQPIVIAEVYPEISDTIFTFPSRIGYQLFHLIDTKLRKIDSFKQIPASTNRNFFFIPSQKIYLLKDHIIYS